MLGANGVISVLARALRRYGGAARDTEASARAMNVGVTLSFAARAARRARNLTKARKERESKAATEAEAARNAARKAKRQDALDRAGLAEDDDDDDSEGDDEEEAAPRGSRGASRSSRPSKTASFASLSQPETDDEDDEFGDGERREPRKGGGQVAAVVSGMSSRTPKSGLDTPKTPLTRPPDASLALAGLEALRALCAASQVNRVLASNEVRAVEGGRWARMTTTSRRRRRRQRVGRARLPFLATAKHVTATIST